MAPDSKSVRKYAAGVERALALFDPGSEWADFIAFLSRLSKALQAAPSEYTDIPLKSAVAKTLSQCLQPNLPAGVHQKALEAYGLIFSLIGVDGLSRDLSLYLPGLSHTLAFASLSTRPLILSIYHDFILKLPAKVIRPALKALVLSLLPGLEEEETSDDFDRTLNTFNHLRGVFANGGNEEFFWQTLFLASIASANRRPGVLVYLTKSLPKLPFKGDEDNLPKSVRIVTTPEPGLLVRCFATGLTDDQPLIQRGFLDLLATNLPLSTPVFRTPAHFKDLVVLVRAATMVVLRRDVSLNRRLWSWFSGSDSKAAQNSLSSPLGSANDENPLGSYFMDFGLQPLVSSIQEMIAVSGNDSFVRARWFRICLSLMDRWDIGGPVVERLFVPLLRDLQDYQATAPSQQAFDEVFRSANIFFDGIESTLVWKQIFHLLEAGDVELVGFVIGNFNLEEEEMTSLHIPAICLLIFDALENSEMSGRLQLVHVLDSLVNLLQQSSFKGALCDTSGTNTNWLKSIKSFYASDSYDSGRTTLLPKNEYGQLLLDTAFRSYQAAIDRNVDITYLSKLTACFEKILAQMPMISSENMGELYSALSNILPTLSQVGDVEFGLIRSSTRIITSIQMRHSKELAANSSEVLTLLHWLVPIYWLFLLPSSPQFHVEVCEDLWRLHVLFRDSETVESLILSLLIRDMAGEPSELSDVVSRFAVLWNQGRSIHKHSEDNAPELLLRPLLHLIDATEDSNQQGAITQWLRGLPSLTPAFRATFAALDEDRDQQTQDTSLALARLHKLIKLAKTSNQWRPFTESAELVEIVRLCSSIIEGQATEQDTEVDVVVLDALAILRDVYDGNQTVPVPEGLMKLLLHYLRDCQRAQGMQEALLDTWLSIVSSRAATAEGVLGIVLDGIASPSVDQSLEKWITLLCNIIPTLTMTVFLPYLLKITECFYKRLESCFVQLQSLFGSSDDPGKPNNAMGLRSPANPEKSVVNLLTGMEYVLARAHQQVSDRLDNRFATRNSSSTDLASQRSFANDHLTVVLCMQDAVKICAKLWLWRSGGRPATGNMDLKSFHSIASRLRSKSRRIMENLIEAEPQECLETLVGIWSDRRNSKQQQGHILELLQTLDGARPKYMMPATFNAIYSRTNPTALDQLQKSSLSTDISISMLVSFLNEYTASLEDDLLEEIWTGCTSFLREILANPMPHRQILVQLLGFLATLSRKMERTNFGDGTRMQRELADLGAKLFTAIFTVKPTGLDVTIPNGMSTESTTGKARDLEARPGRPTNALQIMSASLSDLVPVLTQADRLTSVCNGIMVNVVSPGLRAKAFPHNVSLGLVKLLLAIPVGPAVTKSWKKDVLDTFNHPRFFQSAYDLASLGWMPLIRQICLLDRTVLAEVLARLTPPAAAGLVFGVGAGAARNEADRRTQLDLRRIAVLLLSGDTDAFIQHNRTIFLKVEELLRATPESSPSMASRGDVYLLFRALILSSSQEQLAPLWPLLDTELRDLCEDMLSQQDSLYTSFSKLQGAKLLDLLLLVKPDGFQLHEWLFVTDTTDAIYPLESARSKAYADLLATHLPPTASLGDGHNPVVSSLRRPWLATDDSRNPGLTEMTLAGFFTQLSIRVFEDVYTLQDVDMEICRRDLLADLFTDNPVSN